jgi:hypothetical protein
MSFDEQVKKAPTLTKLWDRFDASETTYRDALRSLLRQSGGREMLYCDGGMLFLKNATQPTDKDLGLKSIGRCSLSDIQQAAYFYTMHHLAWDGVDAMDLQFKMLTKPKYKVFISMHALTLGQDYSFIYPLLVQDEAKYTSRLIERTKVEKDTTALNTLLLALTTRAAKLKRPFTPFRGKASRQRFRSAPSSSRTDCRSWKSDPGKLHEWVKRNKAAIARNATEKDLRDARRKRMRTISDEALYERISAQS